MKKSLILTSRWDLIACKCCSIATVDVFCLRNNHYLACQSYTYCWSRTNSSRGCFPEKRTVRKMWRRFECTRRNTSMSQLDQRTNIKFCQKLGKSATETFQMLQQVYGDDSWVAVFLLGGTDVFRKGKAVWRMCILVGYKRFELNARLRRLQWWCVPTAPNR